MRKQLVLFRPPLRYRVKTLLNQPTLFSLSALIVSLAGFGVALNSLLTSRESLHVGQQPYLSFSVEPKPDSRQFIVWVKNLGNTPAQKIKAIACAITQFGDNDSDLAGRECLVNDLSGSDLGSRDTAFIDKDVAVISTSEAKPSGDGTTPKTVDNYHFGEVRFEDVFLQAHAVRFCFSYVEIEGIDRNWLVRPCDSHESTWIFKAHFYPNWAREMDKFHDVPRIELGR